MRRTSLAQAVCPIARCVDAVGDWWIILILRNALLGQTRFDEFQRHIGIAPNMLTRRLRTLVEGGLLERHRYQERPVRYEYRMTEKGRDFVPVLVAMAGWGNRWLAEEQTLRMVDSATGMPVDPVLIDRATGRPLTADNIRVEQAPPGTCFSKTDVSEAVVSKADASETGISRKD